MKVYLGGPITHMTANRVMLWREQALYRLNDTDIETISPMRGKHFAKDTVLTANFDGGNEAVRRDLWDISRCDVLLANFTGAHCVSIGTCCEIGYARALGKYIVVVRDTDYIHDHVFIEEMADYVAGDLEQAVAWIKEL